MNKNQNILRIVIVVLSFLLQILSYSYFFFIKFEGFRLALSVLFKIIFFLWLSISIILLTVRIIKFQNWRNIKNLIVLLIGITAFCVYLFAPRIVDENTFQSPVKIRCCYEGTMNTSRLYFRENGNFEDTNIGFFANVSRLEGTYTQKNDTLFLSFTKGESRLLGDTLVVKDSILYKIQSDTLALTYYYLGKCKGLN